MKDYASSFYEKETYCRCLDLKTLDWFWIKTEKPHDCKAVEQKLTNTGRQVVDVCPWYTYDMSFVFTF